MKRRTKLRIVAAGLAVLLAVPVLANNNFDCKVLLYKQGEFDRSVSVFSPADKITARVKIHQLPPGRYSLHTEWINPLGMLEEENAFTFEQEKAAVFAAQSWLKLKKAGLFKRLTSVSQSRGYPSVYFGRWKVVFFLNGEQIAQESFDVL